MADAAEVVALIPAFKVVEKFRHSVQHVAIDFAQIVVIHCVRRRVKIVQVAEQKPASVAYFPQMFRCCFQSIWADGNIRRIVIVGHPQAQNIRTVGWLPFLVFAAIDDLSKRDTVDTLKARDGMNPVS